jgi:GNAT superfamily N-acetyltransferase
MTIGIAVRDMRTEVGAGVIEEIYRDILQPSFGSDELDSLDTILGALADSGSNAPWGLCAVDDDAPVGCLLGYPYPQSRVLLIGYVSVKPGLRGGGIGHVLMDAAERRWRSDPNTTLVLAEVEDPRRHPVVGDIDPKRRAAFYARRGAQIVVGPYFQPRLDGEAKKRVGGLFLTVLCGSAVAPDNSVRGEQLTNFLLEYFRDSGEGSDFPRPGDEEGNRLLAWYRAHDTVALHPLGDYAQIDIPRTGG